MKKNKEFIAFSIAILFAFFSIFKDFFFPENVEYNGQTFETSVSQPVIYGLIGLAFIGVFIYYKKNLWKYLFALFVITTIFFPEIIRFHNTHLKIEFGFLRFEIFNLFLLITHLIINPDIFKSIHEIIKKNNDIKNKNYTDSIISRFEKKFEHKTDNELNIIKKNDKYSDEAKIAVKRIIEKRNK